MRLWAPALALLGGLLIAQPAAASIVTETRGQVGAYKLADTSSDPSYRCVYGTPFADNQTSYLTKIRVWPPKMWGRYRAKQQVGWQFLVYRKAHNSDDAWQVAYGSDQQLDFATKFRRADDFNPMAVTLWDGQPMDDYDYAVQIILAWYPKDNWSLPSDGSVWVDLEWYRFMDGKRDAGVFHYPCLYVGGQP